MAGQFRCNALDVSTAKSNAFSHANLNPRPGLRKFPHVNVPMKRMMGYQAAAGGSRPEDGYDAEVRDLVKEWCCETAVRNICNEEQACDRDRVDARSYM